MPGEDSRGRKVSEAIETLGLTKDFDGLRAVDHVDLTVERGEVFGFLGPNGAGKTTAIKMLCTILNPSSGTARVCGHDVVRERYRVRERIGIVFQDPAVDTFLTGRENLDFHARLYHLDGRTRGERIDEVLRLMELSGKENVRIDKCSGGTQRRFEVARGLLNRPEVLFLDEPTLGLDVQARRALWDYIRSLNRQGDTTVILTTHYIEEADCLCDRIAIIDHGRIVAVGEPEELKRVVNLSRVVLETGGAGSDELAALLRELDWVKSVELHGDSIELGVEGAEERVPELIDIADAQGVAVSAVEVKKPTLEEAFLRYTGANIREQEGSIVQVWKAMMMKGRGRR